MATKVVCSERANLMDWLKTSLSLSARFIQLINDSMKVLFGNEQMFLFVLCIHKGNVSGDDRRRRYGAARERKEVYESLAIIRNRVCGDEEGEVRRSSDEEEEIRTK